MAEQFFWCIDCCYSHFVILPKKYISISLILLEGKEKNREKKMKNEFMGCIRLLHCIKNWVDSLSSLVFSNVMQRFTIVHM